LLKSLGMRPRQTRAIVAWQATAILAIAAAAGVPLGVAAGRWAWTVFAGSIGVVPSPQVPLTLLAGGIATLLIAGNLLSAVPGAIAARVSPAAGLRSE
jgi:predicted lysophospholipase L1 biosynthesis ABC-type transport system permease subunit